MKRVIKAATAERNTDWFLQAISNKYGEPAINYDDAPEDNCVNVCNFEEYLRPKFVYMSYKSPNIIEVDWETQEDLIGVPSLKKELKRYFQFMYNKLGIVEPTKVKVTVHDRSGMYEPENFSFTVK